MREKISELINRKRLLDFFMECARIDSVSREERGLADRIKKEMALTGLEVREDNAGEFIGGNAGNLIIDISGDKEEKALLLSAHLDRVEPGRGIIPFIQGEYIESKGNTVLAGDDLIGVSAIVEAIKVLKESGLEHRPFRVIFTVAEEAGLLGAKQLDPEEYSGLEYGFVFDADGEIGTIINRAPAQYKFNVRISGKAAHAGMNPGGGINAIKIASIAISNMKLGQIDEETTANIGVIKGGRASNIVPDLVELEGEIRSHSEEKLLKQKENMTEVIEQACKKYRGKASYDIERLYDSFAISPESDIISITERIFRKMKLKSSLASSGGGSDANIFNSRGLATLNLAVGMENVHSTDERVKIENLYLVTEVIINLLTMKE